MPVLSSQKLFVGEVSLYTTFVMASCRQLLDSASNDPRTYLLLLLLLETGLKKAELLDLKVTHFDLSNKYQPELWVKHEGKQVKKDRKLRLPPEIIPVYTDYMERYDVT